MHICHRKSTTWRFFCYRKHWGHCWNYWCPPDWRPRIRNNGTNPWKQTGGIFRVFLPLMKMNAAVFWLPVTRKLCQMQAGKLRNILTVPCPASDFIRVLSVRCRKKGRWVLSGGRWLLPESGKFCMYGIMLYTHIIPYFIKKFFFIFHWHFQLQTIKKYKVELTW